jgi:microsomal dipeptidase-like Zn-dependent dipeptidase
MKTRVALYAALVVVATAAFGFFYIAPRAADRAFNRVEIPPPYSTSDAAHSLHAQLTIADLHSDQLLWMRDPLKRSSRGHVDVPRLQDGNVAIQVFSAVTRAPRGQNYDSNAGDTDRMTTLVVAQRWPMRTWTSLLQRALYQADRLLRAEARSNGALTIVRTAEDLEALFTQRTVDTDRIGAVLSVEGLHAMEGRIENLQILFDAGYRMMSITHFFDDELGGSAHGLEKGGLTPLGRQVIRRMNEMGVVVDLAHVSEASFVDILMLATKPVVVSHTGVQATCEGPRNLTDDQIRGVSATGGVIGIGYWAGAVCGTDVDHIVAAIQHVVDVAGIEHVALGSDFDGTVHTGFDTTGLVLVTEALLERGFSEEEIRLIMGGNVIRVLRDVLP